MKKSSILILIIFCIIGCKKSSNEVNITGEIKGLGTDTLYLYGMYETLDRIDTIYAENDRFDYNMTVDTITATYLLLKNEIEYPLYLDKRNKIKIKGDTLHLNRLDVTGNIYNEELSAFYKEQEALADSVGYDIEEEVEKFIKEHHSSYVSMYLLDKYFVQKDSIDLPKVKELIDVMTGVLQDMPYIERLNESIPQMEKSLTGKYAPFFSLTNAKGEKITRTSEAFKQKYLLINFWAAWNDTIVNNELSNSELREIYKTYKKNKHLAMLGISFDIDKQEWQDAIERDTLEWEQVCDFGGLNSEVAKQFSIRKLPTNVLLSTDGRILAKDLRGEELKAKVKGVVDEATKREKEEKEKKKKNKKK